MRIRSRKSWVATLPKSAPIKMAGPASRTYIHHDGTFLGEDANVAEVEQRLRDIQHYHQSIKRWNDIAYSFAIDPAGRVYECRGWGIVGAHTEGQNSTSHGIVFLGNFQTQQPTKAALDACRALIDRGKKNGHIKPGAGIRGHQDADGAATACPGSHLYSKLNRIRRGGSK